MLAQPRQNKGIERSMNPIAFSHGRNWSRIQRLKRPKLTRRFIVDFMGGWSRSHFVFRQNRTVTDPSLEHSDFFIGQFALRWHLEIDIGIANRVQQETLRRLFHCGDHPSTTTGRDAFCRIQNQASVVGPFFSRVTFITAFRQQGPNDGFKVLQLRRISLRETGTA